MKNSREEQGTQTVLRSSRLLAFSVLLVEASPEDNRQTFAHGQRANFSFSERDAGTHTRVRPRDEETVRDDAVGSQVCLAQKKM